MLNDLNMAVGSPGQQGADLDWFRKYLDAWNDCGFSPARWPYRDQFQDDINMRTQLVLQPIERASGELKFMRVANLPDPDVEPELQQYEEPTDLGRVEAAIAFLEFLEGPFKERVRTCDRCLKYFLNAKRYERKRYCSRQCSKMDTALRATRDKRQADHRKKIAKVQRWISKVPRKLRSASSQQWKNWVAKKAGVTAKFITQSHNSGLIEISPPWTAQ